MPIYKYKCECGLTFERVTTSASAPVDDECECGQTATKMPAWCRTFMSAHGGIVGAPKKPGFDNIGGRRHPANVRDVGGKV